LDFGEEVAPLRELETGAEKLILVLQAVLAGAA
jgi:hypothetical protein